MLVRAFWPECDCNTPEWGRHRRIDALWVEATQEEAEAQILPSLPPEVAERSRVVAQKPSLASHLGEPPRPSCYLVAPDLSVFVPFKASYPYSHMWNAYSPFGLFDPSLLENLEELRQFIPPTQVEWLGVRGRTPEL